MQIDPDPTCGSLSDSESARSAHRDVRAASQLVEALARRVGFIPDRAPLPRAIQQRRWSPFNVPLMLSAAGTSATTPIVERMVFVLRLLTMPAVEFHEGSMEPDAAVVARIDCVEGCDPWMGHHGSGRSHHEALSRRIPSVCSWQTHFRKGPGAHFATRLAQSTPEWRCWKSCTF